MSVLTTPDGSAVAEESEARTVDEALAQELVERARSEGVASRAVTATRLGDCLNSP